MEAVFEIREGGHVYWLFPDGTIEGFGPNAIVFNRFPRLAGQGRVMDWKPIETAPKDGTRVLVYVADYDKVTEAWYCEDTGLWPHNEPYTEEYEPCNVGLPTHWMPLPEPPKAEE